MDDNGVAGGNRLIIPDGRVVEKKTHCGNCMHFEAGTQFAKDRIGQHLRFDLQNARRIAETMGVDCDPLGTAEASFEMSRLMSSGMSAIQAEMELHQRMLLAAKAKGDVLEADKGVKKVRTMMALVEKGDVGTCKGGGVTPQGGPVGVAVFAGYHCHKWSGASGWSMAHDLDRKLDPLPAELVAIADEKAKSIK